MVGGEARHEGGGKEERRGEERQQQRAWPRKKRKACVREKKRERGGRERGREGEREEVRIVLFHTYLRSPRRDGIVSTSDCVLEKPFPPALCTSSLIEKESA